MKKKKKKYVYVVVSHNEGFFVDIFDSAFKARSRCKEYESVFNAILYKTRKAEIK